MLRCTVKEWVLTFGTTDWTQTPARSCCKVARTGWPRSAPPGLGRRRLPGGDGEDAAAADGGLARYLERGTACGVLGQHPGPGWAADTVHAVAACAGAAHSVAGAGQSADRAAAGIADAVNADPPEETPASAESPKVVFAISVWVSCRRLQVRAACATSLLACCMAGLLSSAGGLRESRGRAGHRPLAWTHADGTPKRRKGIGCFPTRS